VTQEYQDKFESLAPLRAKQKAQKAGATTEDPQGAVVTPAPPQSPPTIDTKKQ
jgi:hypothetical protein